MHKKNPTSNTLYSFKTKIPLKKLLKGSMIVNFAPILIIIIFMINGYLALTHAVALSFGIFILSLLFIYPYLADLQELTKYVNRLTSNRKTKKPQLSFLNNVEELSTAIDTLNNKWLEKSSKLERNLKKEKKTQQMIQDFVANASHEMKTPLSSIKGFAETILDMGEKSEDEIKFINIIRAQSQRLEDLISEMLILARLEEEGSKAEPLNLIKIITLIENSLSTQIVDHDINLQFIYPKKTPNISANNNDITRAIENLISNAIRYNPDGTNVEVKISNISKLPQKFKSKHKDKKFIKISVKDDGIGIKEQHIPRLIERFYRVDKARSRKVGGSGLGLSIVNQIALNHGGFLDIQSKIEEGSEFSIYLPV